MKLLVLITLPFLPAAVWAQTAPSGGAEVTGIAALLAQLGLSAVFLWQWRVERAERIGLQTSLLAFLEKQAPIIEQAASVLHEVQDAMRAQVEQNQPDKNEWDRALRRVEMVGDELREELRDARRGRHPSRGDE